MKNIKYKILFISFLLILISYISITIYCFAVYGNKSIDEIPAWALFFSLVMVNKKFNKKLYL